jgi:hypothetical protein
VFGASGEAYYAATEVRRMLDAPAPGPVYRVPGWRWVRVMNPDGVDTPQQHIGFGELCIVRYRSEVQMIGYSVLKGDLVTVRNPENRAPIGVLCPDDTVFFSTDSDLAQWESDYQQRLSQEAALANFAQASLDAPDWGSPLRVERWDWVEVMNPGGITAFGYDVDFLETCGIDVGSTMQPIGQHPDFGTLALYTAHDDLTFDGTGIPCPTGTVFVMETDHTYRNLSSGSGPMGIARHGGAPNPAALAMASRGSRLAHRTF